MQPPSHDHDRVRDHTPAHVNARIDARAERALAEVRAHGPGAIQQRSDQLEREWDVDRALLLVFAVLGTVTHEGGNRGVRWMRHLLRVQLGFLAWHAIAGWCPPVAVLRRLGFRTSKEIAAEKDALAAAR